ncbi:MAG: AglZ/HisF2 family acetamidino modification protein [Burkholderiaceae bacterium]
MLRPRILPCLLVQDGGLVKTMQFGRPKYVGDPINAVKIFNEKRADELMVLDIDASRLAREPNMRLIAQFAVECRMPLCYGGGIKTVEQARKIVRLGVEKVAISSAALGNPQLVSSIANEIGSQSVVVVLDVKIDPMGAYEVCTFNATRGSRLSPVECAQQAEFMGAGEVVLNSVDRDGQMLGYDLALAQMVRPVINLPMTMLGGAGSLADMGALFDTCAGVGAAAGSMFVFKGPLRAVLINYPDSGQKESLFRAAGSLHRQGR